MSLQHIKIESVTVEDLQRLIDDQVPESKVIEYKQALQYETEAEKRELLSDVTAIANTEGGDIIYGLAETENLPSSLPGLRNFSFDQSRGKIENLLRDFVQPRVVGLSFAEVNLANGNKVFLIRIPQSLTSPHMVMHKGVSRFCARNAGGKYDLDVHELRSAFVANESLGERVRNFRMDRIAKLLGGNGPVALMSDSLVVIHVLPVIGAKRDDLLGARELQRVRGEELLHTPSTAGWNSEFNFDGYLKIAPGQNGLAQSYSQLMRNGFIEGVSANFLNRPQGSSLIPTIPGTWIESALIKALQSYMELFRKLDIAPPFTLGVSLLNVRDFSMVIENRSPHASLKRVDRDNLITREILIDDPAVPPETILKPAFDQLWSSCGFLESPSFNGEGKWEPGR